MSALTNCLEATRLISKSQHQKLTLLDGLALNAHLVLCKYCKSFQKDLTYVKVKLSEIDQEEIYLMNESYKKELAKKVLEELEK
ncbi:MAG: hypothetical protein KJ712_00375 [Bacteroidetes bacterium]|nr:hypothetical protein [Bacteroidota bacterium]MBU1486075.1 hypothetical protein [Bacteroidota bacterium]MBU2045167.1 hypothetical protein [Bacteroidota bacterium]MBU2267647.1 hypothetical protein [Bacteroidota bacterium]MBU2374461.1 hypothetical protein [Bacteroidota bacterium]